MSKPIREATDILDQGYVKLWDVMGDELRIVNAARVSFNKKKEVMEKDDEGLLNFLMRNHHDSPFRHCYVTLEVCAPIMVMRQLMKYRIGSEFNEMSRRYVTEDLEFYIPDEDAWRSAPKDKKQGSGEPVDPYTIGAESSHVLKEHVEESVRLYEAALEAGIAAEQARLFLPGFSVFTKVYWTASLQTIAHMVKQREAKDSQYEIQLYASAVRDIVEPAFPNVLPKLINRKEA